MKCWFCDKQIEYKAGNQFFIIEADEIMCGEHCYFPGLIGRYFFCSFNCIREWMKKIETGTMTASIYPSKET